MSCAFCSRTHSDVRTIRHLRIYDVCHPATYVLFCRRRTQSCTYVTPRDPDSGLHSRDGVGTTQSTPGVGTTSGSDEEDPLGPSCLSLATKITIDTSFIYGWTLIIKLQLSCYVSHRALWCPMFGTTPPTFWLEIGCLYTLLYLRDVRHCREHSVKFGEHFEHSLTFVNFCHCYVIAIE